MSSRHLLPAAVLFSGLVFAQQGPVIGGCPAFPANNIWNAAVDTLPVHSRSANYINSISSSAALRYDISIPVNIVPGTQPLVPMYFGTDEADPGPYPFPPNAQMEGGSDRHVIVVDKDHCVLYETYDSYLNADGSWNAGIGAKWSLASNALRTATYSSADAAGLPILPGLLRYEEMAAGQINHALRFTAPRTQKAFVWPGRHYASSNTDPALPPMGQRFRLKAGFDISGFSANMQVVLRALKKYGLMLADNGNAWEMQIAVDSRWNETELLTLRSVVGSQLEAVDVSSLMIDPNSGQAGSGSVPAPALASVAVSPASIFGGNNVSVTVNLTLPAPAGGVVVALTGSNAAFPGTAVTVPAGVASQTFSLPTTVVATTTTVIVTASYNGVSVQSAPFTINPVPPSVTGTAAFVKTDTTTAGSWKGVYGADGVGIMGDTSAYPAYVNPAVSGNASWLWASSTSDLRAPQKVSASDRIAACWYASGSFSIDLNFTDGKTHQVALYLLDWDTRGRSQRVDILDANSTALDTRGVSGFSGGVYLVWTLGGHVIVRITNTGPNNGLMSGLYFGGAGTVTPPPAAGTAAFVKTDTTTAGTWKGVYGADGAGVMGDTSSYPAYVSPAVSGNSSWLWASSTSDLRAPQKVSASDRIAACWYASGSFSIDLNFTDGKTHQVALYLLDWDARGRSQRVDILDANSTALDTRGISGFSGGVYLVWTLGGHVTVRITNTGPNNGLMSGLFFGGAGTVTPPPATGTASFLKTDTTTAGTWKGVYGADGWNVINDSSSYPGYVRVTPAGNASWLWAGSTNDPRAPQKGYASDRIAACWYSGAAFSVDLVFTDSVTHQVALYLLDWDNLYGGRSQRVDVLDPNGAVLDSRAVSGFSGGRYLVWNLSGHVTMRITNTGAANSNALLSGIFFR
jgi:hypothetical protein